MDTKDTHIKELMRKIRKNKNESLGKNEFYFNNISEPKLDRDLDSEEPEEILEQTKVELTTFGNEPVNVSFSEINKDFTETIQYKSLVTFCQYITLSVTIIAVSNVVIKILEKTL